MWGGQADNQLPHSAQIAPLTLAGLFYRAQRYFAVGRRTGRVRMAGVLDRLKDMLSITERVKPPEGNERICGNCIHWLPPASLTVAITKSQRALDWARQGGYGNCRAPRPAAENDDGKDAQRFTLERARCKLWTWKGAPRRA